LTPPARWHRRQRFAARTPVPTASLHGGGDGVFRAEVSAAHHGFFTGPCSRRVLDRIGHNVAQEATSDFAQAVRELSRRAARGLPSAAPHRYDAAGSLNPM
jgi:pimeloyl-ACP methyl ester carboxylesterase